LKFDSIEAGSTDQIWSLEEVIALLILRVDFTELESQANGVTNDELIEKAKEYIKFFEDPKRGITLEMVPKIRVLDAYVIYFENDDHKGKIQVFLEKESGKFISASASPP
jgi:hypothetical protein